MEQEVHFKKNRKKLPNIILLPLFLLILGSICAALLSLTNQLTEKAIAENEAKAASEEAKEIKNLLKNYDMVIVNNVNDDTDNAVSNGENSQVKSDQLAAIDAKLNSIEFIEGRGSDNCHYEVSDVFYCKSETNNYLAFKVLHTNNFTTVTTIVVLNIDDNTISHVQVIGKATTLGASKDKLFTDKPNDWEVAGKTKDNFSGSFDIISGSTFSSKSVKMSIKYSYQQLDLFKDVLEEVKTLGGQVNE